MLKHGTVDFLAQALQMALHRAVQTLSLIHILGAAVYIRPRVDTSIDPYNLKTATHCIAQWAAVILCRNFNSDLSRGCNAEEVYKMALITAALI